MKGIKRGEFYPYILRGERESEDPTIWELSPVGAREGNRSITGFVKAQSRRTDDAVAEGMTKQDLNDFLMAVRSIRNWTFADDEEPTVLIDEHNEKEKVRVFYELDSNSINEITNAAKNIFALRECEKKELSSPSGADLNGSTVMESDTTASDASSRDPIEDSIA